MASNPYTTMLAKQSRIIPTQQQNMAQSQHLLNGQHNFYNNSLLQSAPQLSEAIYFPTQAQHNSLNPLNQPSNYQPLHKLHEHSIVTSINSMQQSTLDTTAPPIFDTRLTRMFPTERNGAPSISETYDNHLTGTSHLTNPIVLENFAPSLQADHSNAYFRTTTSHLPQQSHFHPTLHLPHSNGRQQQQQAQQNDHLLNTLNCQDTDLSTTMTPTQIMQMNLPTAAHQPIFLSSDAFGTAAPSAKMSTYLPFKVNSTYPTASTNEMVASTSSPVVLDRINICINNHYTDSNYTNAVVADTATCTSSSADVPSLSSPIIPPIQHSEVIDPSLLMEPPNVNGGGDVCNILTGSTLTTVPPPIVNEPDSTTTSHTPPSTPDTVNSTVATISAIQSPSTSSTAKLDECFKSYTSCSTKFNAQAVVDSLPEVIETVSVEDNEKDPPELVDITLPEETLPIESEQVFEIGNDVFVKIDDDRLYLGTIIDSKYQRYRVRFDDASEMWCSPKQIQKFGVSVDNGNSTGEKSLNDSGDTGTLCVACKKRGDTDDVEICERCGRGYHKFCTTETSLGSGDWLCKRCCKPMKIDASENDLYNESSLSSLQQQLPYDAQKLHWDKKHRVNEEQIYCYCGKTGQFDNNMLQCCKCLNWFHTKCVQNFKGPMLRGDGFFVFCCCCCSKNGTEYLRRLQINTVDFMHLVLYNLSAQKKHQHNKYHHLIKDIWPFVLSQRKTTAFPEEWLKLSEDLLKECVSSTLKENAERFSCGREVKRDYYFYSLRSNGPPTAPKIALESNQEINDAVLKEIYKIKLKEPATFDIEHDSEAESIDLATTTNDAESKDEKFTSDDDIPIKLILEKEKSKNNFLHAEFPTTKKVEVKSHKRKAFTLSRPYKESKILTTANPFVNTSNCETSSDENSSSSRGTSLDLIIPPPKDFLGANNPFRMYTAPKKDNNENKICALGRSNLGGPTIKNSIVNASAFDFCSNLAALKNAGMFPNLNTTNFARAAGQPRMVRTIKRRLSAKDIMIGPNQEIRRRRTRRLSSNVEIISTTTINPLRSFFPINTSSATGTMKSTMLRKQNITSTLTSTYNGSNKLSTTSSSSSKIEKKIEYVDKIAAAAAHGRRLRLRPPNSLPTNSRRSSLSGLSTSSSSSTSTSSSGNATPQTATAAAAAAQYTESASLNDLQQTVNEYFGVGIDLTETGEQFSIHAKRQLPNGQIQILVEWGGGSIENADSMTGTGTETAQKTNSQENS